ncbi:MAG: flagellar filament capping protein FliD, partial [Candidatus Poribacteria bacterium]|nr:flagellar filament capping protein FliD [Candidatus Poribacteria bacterium]
FDDSNNSSLSSGRYLYVGVNSTSVYRYDMETTANSKLGEVVEYDLSGLGISNVQNITVSHPSSTQTILYVTDSGDNEKVSAFDISTGIPTPVSMTTVSSADEVFIGRDNDGNQKVHFVDDSTLYTMSDLTATNAFMSALNMSEDSGTAGKDLIGRLNGVEFQRNQNETNDLLTGVTLNFKDTTGIGSPVSVTVEPDTDSVVDSVKTFVDQYNETETALREAVNARRIFNPRTEEELVQGVLANDTMLRSLMMRLSSISSLPVVGTGSVKRLADLGINRGRAGSVSIDQIKSGLELKLDESKLRSAISSNPEGAASIFGSVSTLSTKAHRPIPKETETIVTVSSANYSLLETKIGRQVLIENSTSGTVIPMTLTGVSASGSQLTLASGTFSAADYGGYDLELVTNNTNPWHAIKINSTTVNATNNETVLKINDGGMVNPLKDLQNLNRVSNKLNSAVDVQIKTSLGSNLSNSATSSITLSDASKFADSGTIVVSEIDSSALQYEVITYTGKSGNTLTGLTRGVDISSSVTTSATAFTTSNSAKVSQTLFSVNVTDVDADDNFVTVGGYLDTDLVNTTNSKIVSVDGTVADITMTAIEQSGANQSILKVDPSLAREFSGGTKLRLKQGSQTNDLNVLSLDIDPISGFSSKAIPPAGDVSTGNTTQATPTSGKITTGGTSTTKMTVWADDLRSFIGRSRLMLSNGTTDEIAEIDSIDAKPRMLSNFIGTAGSPYTTLFTYTVAGSADRNGDITITADNVGLGSGSANLSTLGTNDHADRGKFEVHVGDIQHDVDTFGGNFSTSAGTYTVSTTSLASLINSVSGVSATTEGTNNNYIYIESDDDNTPINIVGKTNGIQLFSATNRDEDLIKFKGIAEVTLDTPANVPNLTGFNTIKAAYNDTMTVQGMLPTLTTGDLLVEGIAESTENVMAAYTKLSTGIIGNRLKNIQRQTRAVKEDMETFDDKIVVKETKLLREFGALEAALGETQIQSQYLTAQLASLQSTAQAMASRKRK